MKSSADSRSPMKLLSPRANIPIPPKSTQLGIDAFAKKREGDDISDIPNARVKKLKTEFGETFAAQTPNRVNEQTVICHQCRQPCYAQRTLRCTRLKRAGSMMAPTIKRCSTIYCGRCLKVRYDEDISTARAQSSMAEGHVDDAGYTWSCLSCRQRCNCSLCRKKIGLAPLG